MSSNISRRASRKKQTRLTFDPVEPSSSATMSPARVRYQRGADYNNGLGSSPRPKLASEDDLNRSSSNGPKKSFFNQTPKRLEKNSKISFPPHPTPATSSHTKSSQSLKNMIDDSDDSVDDEPFRQHRSNLPQNDDPASSISFDSGPTTAPPPSFLTTRSRGKKTKKFGEREDSSEGSAPEDMSHTISPAVEGSEVDSSDSESLMIYSGGIGSRKTSKTAKNQASSEEKRKTPKTGRSFISGGYSAPVVRPTPKKSPRNKEAPASASRRKSNTTESEHDEIHDIFPTPRRTQRLFRRTEEREIENDSDEPIPPTHGSQRAKQASQQSKDEDSDDDVLPDISQIETYSSKPRKGRSSNKESTQADDDDSDDVVLTSSTKRRHTITIDDDEDDPVVSSPLKRRRAVVVDDDEDEDIAPSSPSKRLRQGTKRKGKEKAVTINDDEEEDNGFGKSKRTTRQKQPRKPHRSEREKKMELLRRKRAGEKITELTPSASEDEEDRQALYDTDSDLQVLSEFEDEEEEDAEAEAEATEQIRRAIRNPSTRNKTGEEDDDDIDDDNFVVEDDDGPLGAPSSIHHLHEIPLEFTHQAHKPLKEHFKDAIEWMVQNRINPRFARSDPIYTRAFTKLDDEVRGYALSKFTSSAWNEKFTRALWARPAFYEADLSAAEIGLEKKCDACGRSGHPAKFQIMFGGRAYSKSTLEVVDDGKERDEEEDGEEGADTDPFTRRRGKKRNENALDSDEEDDDDSSSTTFSSHSSTASLNSTGNPLPRTSHVWNVGRFCKSNAEMAHSLIHWKHALNEWVVEQLKGEDELSAAKLSERQNWSTARAGKHANRIVDRWESEGVIKGLYRDFKGNLEGARESKQGRWG